MAAQLTENQKTWVAALRSGEYQQTDRYLKLVSNDGDTAEYCCLGIACELSERATAHLAERASYYIFTSIDDSYESNEFYPPRSVTEWLGVDNTTLTSNDVWLDVPEEIANLTEQGMGGELPHLDNLACALLNDQGFTFEQIADCIEYFGIKSLK